MTGAVVFRWGSNVAGREATGLEAFGTAIERFEALAKQNRIHSHREYIALTGQLGGFMIVEGDVEELQKIMIEPETLALNSKAEAIVHDFSITLYGGGSDATVQELMGTFAGALSELGYM